MGAIWLPGISTKKIDYQAGIASRDPHYWSTTSPLYLSEALRCPKRLNQPPVPGRPVSWGLSLFLEELPVSQSSATWPLTIAVALDHKRRRCRLHWTRVRICWTPVQTSAMSGWSILEVKSKQLARGHSVASPNKPIEVARVPETPFAGDFVHGAPARQRRLDFLTGRVDATCRDIGAEPPKCRKTS